MSGNLDRVKAKNLSNFRYLGEISNQEVNKLFNKSHILINTSLAEGLAKTIDI